MTPERWKQVDQLLQDALERGPAERAAFLVEACDGDDDLRREVESLLGLRERAESFFETPPADVAADWLAAKESRAGQTIGHYRLIRRIGRGGMGEVYLARDTRLERQVALKLLPPRFTEDAQRVQRFRQEARAASALNHPNIITIHEIGEVATESGGAHFIATEFIEGRTLRELIRDGGMKAGEALEMAMQAASALSAAHTTGITHRDIKPENLMVRPDGLVKVLDFGLAKLNRDTSDQYATAGGFTGGGTRPGVILGTVNYMSPEQARGEKVDARSDLFSLGTVFYEMLTGKRPFTGPTSSHVLVAIQEQEPPPLSRYVSGLPAELQRIVERALAKPLPQRYQTAREIGDDLKRLKEELEFTARLRRSTTSREQVLNMNVGAATTAEDALTLATNASAVRTTSRRAALISYLQWRGKTVALAFAALLLLITGAVLGRRWLASPAEAINSIAVLPFANPGSDPQMAYLPDGLTESLIDSLSQLPALRVSARSTVASYKGREVDPRQAGKELQVRAVVVGRVVWQGDRLIIRVELVDTANGARVWSDEFQRTRSQIVTVQSEITREIAAKLHRRLSPASQQQLARRHSTDSKAYELYAQGRDLYLRYDRKSLEKALDYFRQAIALDPRYALAYCGIADAYSGFSSQYLPSSEVIPKAREAALKAIELDETLPEAHYSLALVKLWGDWDWAGAEREYKRALELNPNFVVARIYYAEFLSQQKRFEEALREIRWAEESDPASLQAMGREGYIHYQMRQYDRAIEVYHKILGLNPNRVGIQRDMAIVLSQQGKHQEAIAMVSQFQTPALSVAVAYIYARAGRRGEALKLLRELKARAAHERVSPFSFARIYIGLGDKEQALVWLRKGYEEQSDHLLHIGADPMLDPLRSDPRFIEMLRGIGLAP